LVECDRVGFNLNLAKLDCVYTGQNLAEFDRIDSIEI